jgi:cytidyltransferase-like protein
MSNEKSVPGTRPSPGTRRSLVAGSFDDLRLADVRLLEEAARWGPVHAVLWSDEAVCGWTGKPPKFPLAERYYLVQSIRYIDQVSTCEASAEAGPAPPLAGRPPGTWVVRESEDAEDKRRHCRRMGWEYHVVAQALLEQVPVHPEGTREAAPSPHPEGTREGAPRRKRVLVTGCFDWFHSGHVRFFEEVAALGDLYVVVGHDANIRFLKGDGHPLFPQAVRRYMVGAVRCVRQALVATGHGWLDAEPEIRRIRPHIYAVNADGDRPEKRAYCAANGIEYRVLQRVPKPGLPPRKSTDLRGF